MKWTTDSEAAPIVGKPTDLTPLEDGLWDDAEKTYGPATFAEWVSDFIFLRGAQWAPEQMDEARKRRA